MTLSWSERLPMLSMNPDAATRTDVARLAAELMEANHILSKTSTKLCRIHGNFDKECVFDGNGFEIKDCAEALKLSAEEKGRDDCQFWRDVVSCKECGHILYC